MTDRLYRVRNKAHEFLDHYEHMNSIMEKKFDYPLFFIGGTLLGYIREGDFLENDYDMDVSYFSKYEKVADVRAEMIAVVSELIDSGEDIHLIRPDCTLVRNYFRWSFDERDRIDVMPTWSEDGYIFRPTFVAYPGSKDIILPLHEKTFYDHRIFIPNKPEVKLANVYGDDWRIPNPEFKKNTRKTEKTIRVVSSELSYDNEQWPLIRKTRQWSRKTVLEKLFVKMLYLRKYRLFALIIPNYQFFKKSIFKQIRSRLSRR